MKTRSFLPAGTRRPVAARTRLAIGLAASAVLALTVVVSVAPAAEAATLSGTFYVDNAAGSSCSNGYVTTSPTTPWCDFTNLQGQTFAAGSSILLKAGDTWNQELGKLYGSGTSASPIVLGSYGTGARPHIGRSDQASDRGIWIENGDYWKLSNLEVSDAGAGIVLYYSTNGHQGMSLDNIYIHNMTGVVSGSPAQTDLPGMYHSPGIFVTGQVPVTASSFALNGLALNAITGYQNRDDVDIAGFNPGGVQGFLNTTLGSHTVENVTITDSAFRNAYAGSNFDNLTHLRILSTVFDSNIQAFQAVGTTQVFFWSDTDVTTLNSTLTNGPATGSPDQTGSDLEAYDNAVRFHGNYIAGNAGAGIEVLGLGGRSGDASTNIDVSNNAFSNNASSGSSNSSVWFLNASGESMTGSATNNLYYEPTGFTTTAAGSQSWTFSGNQAVAQSSLYAAAPGFSSTQGGNGWGYQSSTNGTTWSNLSYTSANAIWGSTAGGVTAFDLYPPTTAGSWVARTWTAPTAGTVDLRGWVAKTQLGGSGVTVRITDNATTVFSSTVLGGSDQDGFATPVDNVTVAAGDVLRFAVSAVSGATSGLTSWTPSVGYVAAPGSSPVVVAHTTTGTGVDQVNYASGTWGSNSNVHYNTSTSGSDYYTVQFTGRQVVVHGGFNTDHGIAGYSICNAAGGSCGAEKLVDTYASSSILDQVLYTSPLEPTGTYTLKVRNTGTKSASSSDHYIDVGSVVVSSAPTVVSNTTTGSGVDQVNYASGTWGSNSDVHYNTSTSGSDYYTVQFTGRQVVVHGGFNSDHGIAGYSICNAAGGNCGPEKLVDTYASSSILDQVLYTSPLEPSGTYTLKVRNTGSKNAASSDHYIDVGSVIVN